MAETPANDPGAEIAKGTAQGNVGFALAEVAEFLAVVELDHDFGVAVMQFAKHRRQQSHREYFLGGNANGAARVSRVRGRGLGKGSCSQVDLTRTFQQLFASGRQGVACLALLKEWKSDRFLQRGDTAGDGRLADAQRTTGRQRTALVGDTEEIFQVIPVEHILVPAPNGALLHSALLQNHMANSLLPPVANRDY